MSQPKGKIAVGMSGGTDSSLAAWLLRGEGYDVVGITMRLWSTSGETTDDEHVGRARTAADKIGIRHHVVDLQTAFEQEVVTPFLDAYASGATPSPCVLCNPTIKFGALLDCARQLGCSALATGHYVRRVAVADGLLQLRRGVDPAKDQSYFLARLTIDQLRCARFPLGGMHKADVRARSAELGLTPVSHSESQDLCFIPNGDYAGFVSRHRPGLDTPGPIVSVGGETLGAHHGFFRYTIGQRQGLGLGGGPWYVTELRPASNTVVVGRREDVLTHRVTVRGINWLGDGAFPGNSASLVVQLRYRMKPVAVADIAVAPDGSARVNLAEPASGVAPGQAAVFYDGDRVMGSGWIAPER